MMLSSVPVLLAVFALAIAAPENYGKYAQAKMTKAKPIITTTLPADVPLEFDCSDKADGGYVIGCSQDYYLCWKGAMTKSSCPEGMIFNQENGQCDFNINVFECTGVRTTTPLAEETTTLKPVDFDCSKLTDGDYAFSHDCQLNYVSCVGGKGVERVCPDNLSFDPVNRLCDRLETIEACGGSPTTVAPTMAIEFECPSPSGSFPITSQLCSAVYYICNDNVATIAICDDPMIWDDAHKVCALPKDIPDCSFDCAGKADAAYSAGCSQNYWWCWQERATKLACPEKMVFDVERALCDFQENVFECTGVHTTTPAAEVTTTIKPVDFDCTGLEDGNHQFKNGELCQPKFVSCVGGFAWEMTCPDGLMFDPEQMLCERIEAIVACGGTAEPTTTLLTTTASYGYKQTTLADKPIPRRVHKTTKAPLTTTKAADVPKSKYGSYKPTTKAPITTTTVADVPKDDYDYETTLADEPITTTRKAYTQRTTTLADEPILTTTRKAYHQRKTTTLADLPTTRAYNVRKTTTLADIPTTRSYGSLKTTTLADEPITEESDLGYNADSYGSKIILGKPTTVRRMLKTTTVAADLPINADSYGSYETTTLAEPIMTTRRRMHKTTTVAADLPINDDSYGSYETTTLAEPITTTRKAYHQRKLTTTLADIPTTRAYGSFKKTTTLADIPTTQSYGDYEETTLADEPLTTTMRRRMHKTTTVAADLPINDDSYGSYETTTLAEPITTTRKAYNQRKLTTTLADIPTTRAYGSFKKTTTLADIPVTRSYGSLKTTTPLADLPTTTMRRRTSYTKIVKPEADLPQKPIKQQGY